MNDSPVPRYVRDDPSLLPDYLLDLAAIRRQRDAGYFPGERFGFPDENDEPTPPSPPPRKPSGPCRLYRHWNVAGELLYVGITGNGPKRNSNHALRSEWFSEVVTTTWETYSCRSDALIAERLAIETEDPLHNLAHSRRIR